MNSYIKIATSILILLLVGEVAVRLDERYDPMKNAPQRWQARQDLVEQKPIENDSNELRILITGDSYIQGGPLGQYRFSEQLKNQLRDNYNIEATIIDASRSSNNTLDNANYALYHIEHSAPTHLLWAYNFNDVVGSLHRDSTEATIDSLPSFTPKNKSWTKILREDIYAGSRLLFYISTTLQKELKTRGIMLPFGTFYQLNTKTYQKTNKQWLKNTELMNEVWDTCLAHNISATIITLPEFNLIHHPNLFTNYRSTMTEYIETIPSLNQIDGYAIFPASDTINYQLSRYDGHPNEYAHKKLAVHLAKELVNSLDK